MFDKDEMTTELGKKADSDTVNQELSQKANKDEMTTELGKKADKDTVTQELDLKAEQTDVEALQQQVTDLENALDSIIDYSNTSGKPVITIHLP